MDIMEILQGLMTPALFPGLPIGLFGLGYTIKGSKKISSHLIPNVSIIVGSIISFIYNLTVEPLGGLSDVMLVLVRALGDGILGMMLANGFYQWLKQNGIEIGKNNYDLNISDITKNVEDGKGEDIDDNT